MNFFKGNILIKIISNLKLVVLFLVIIFYSSTLIADTILDPNFATPSDDFILIGYPTGISSFMYTSNFIWPNNSVPSGWYNYKGGITTINMGTNRNIQFYYPQQQLIGVSQLYFRQYDGVTNQWIGWQKVVSENSDGNVGIGLSNPSYRLQVTDVAHNNYVAEIRNSQQDGHGLQVAAGGYSDTIVLRVTNKTRSNDLFIVKGDGKVGIGTTSPSYELDVAGTTSSYLYHCSSDVRYKKNISPYENALEKVLGLRGVSYFWKAEKYKERNFSKDKQVGFIAQEVEKIIPELVFTDDKGYKTMSYDRLTAVIVEAIKELKVKNDSEFTLLKKENTILKQDIASLKQENSDLKVRLAELDSIADRLATLEKSIGIAKIASR